MDGMHRAVEFAMHVACNVYSFVMYSYIRAYIHICMCSTGTVCVANATADLQVRAVGFLQQKQIEDKHLVLLGKPCQGVLQNGPPKQ